MRKITAIIIAFLCFFGAEAQKYVFKPNGAPKSSKEDPYNEYDAENISVKDILSALELMDIRIFKFDIPRTDKERPFSIVVDEYSKSQIVKSDTIRAGKNSYYYWEKGDTIAYKDFIDQITIFTKSNSADSMVQVRINTYSRNFGIPIKYKPERKDSFYNIRKFRQGDFRIGEKMPMIAIASSWYDPRYDITRFCGAAVLTMNDPDTKELLDKSPNYYIISYIIQ